jgi:2-methylcitrate dehydratase
MTLVRPLLVKRGAEATVSPVKMRNQDTRQEQVRELAAFARRCSFADLSDAEKIQLKTRVLDTLGCAIGALGAPQMSAIRMQIEEYEGDGPCTLIGGKKASPDRAAFYNGALVRYLDFNDSYLSGGDTCQPSNNFGAVLAAAECAEASGRDLLDALAAAYEVQCALAEKAPLGPKGFDAAAHGSYAAAAGAARALRLNPAQTANAIAIAGAANNPLAVRRPGSPSDWKRLAHPAAAGAAMHAALMAARGITGPTNVLEGTKGFMQSVAGDFDIDWNAARPHCITRSIIKKYSASVHAQSCIEGILELWTRYKFDPEDVGHIEIKVSPEALPAARPGANFEISPVTTREQAAESLPFMVAAALLDGELTPAQYEPERITRNELQNLLEKVHVGRERQPGGGEPERLPCNIRVSLRNGSLLERSKSDYEGFHTRPAGFRQVYGKFKKLTGGHIGKTCQSAIADTVARLEAVSTADLTRLLAQLH